MEFGGAWPNDPDVAAEEAYVYVVTREGNPLHYGTSNDPARRLGEHFRRFGEDIEMEVLSGPHLEPIAVQLQNELLDQYMARHGRLPAGNSIRN